MSDTLVFELRITPDGIFYIAYGQIRHYARREAIQELILTEDGMLVTLLGAGADQFEIPIDHVVAQGILWNIMNKGWPIKINHSYIGRWPIDSEDTIPF